jgi:hypothetical protein
MSIVCDSSSIEPASSHFVALPDRESLGKGVSSSQLLMERVVDVHFSVDAEYRR